jgi:hypothetical protein
MILIGVVILKRLKPSKIVIDEHVNNRCVPRYRWTVRVAIVRKTFVAMYYMLKNDEPYRFMDTRIYSRKAREIEKILENAA